MSGYEQQMLDTECHFTQMMKEIEQVDPNILYTLVPGSQLHQKICNPVIENIDEE